MKKILSLLIAISVILSATAVFPAVAEETEELKVYFYEDFVTGYESDEMTVKSFGNVKRSFLNGQYVLEPTHPQSGTYQHVSFGTTIKIPEETKVVLEYTLKGTVDGGSNYFGYGITSGIPTVIVQNNGVNAYSHTDKSYIASTSLQSGVTITIVYDNENPLRDIFVNGNYTGTFDMGESDHGSKFCDENVFPLFFQDQVKPETNVYYSYIKIYQAPSDYNPETFQPHLFRNIGKGVQKSDGVIKYSDSFYFDVISGLGFYNKANLGEYKPDEPMTRLQFAGILAEIMNVTPTTEPTHPYTDIARRHFMSGTLDALNKMGLMKGISANEFGKDIPITLPMISAALCRGLGYEEFAEYYSGYEAGYLAMADKAELFKGVSQTDNLKSKDIIRILYNFMNSEIYATVGIKGNSFIKEATKGNTILKAYHGIASVRDILKSNEVTSLTSQDGTGDDSVVIGSLRLNTDGTSLNQYLGYSIEAYYDIEDEKILFAGITNKNNSLVIESDAFVSYSDEKIYYNKDAKELKVALSVNADIIYNGKFEPFSKKLFNGIENGNITLIDNDDDKKYDVAFINSYINGVVDTKSNDGMVIRFKNNIAGIRLEDYEAYDIKDAAGKNVSFDSIASNNILSIQESKEKSYILITVGTASHIGALSEIYSDENTTRLNIEGKLIKADPVFVRENTFLSPGITGEFFADAYGKIAFYSEISTRSSGFAYFIGMWEEGMMQDYVNIKMYTEGKQLVELKTAKNITIDGVAGQNCKALINYRQLFNWIREEDPNNPGTVIETKGKAKPQLISYKLNENGELKEIDTLYYNRDAENPENTLMEAPGGYLRYNSINISFGTDLYLNDGCTVFTIPYENITSAEADEFDIRVPTAMFRDESYYTVSAYKTSAESLGADILVTETKGGGGFDSYDHVYVVSGISEIWSEKEDTTIKKLSYFHTGKEKSCLVPEASYLDGISKGDIVILSINSDNELTQAPKLRYDLDADTDGLEETVQVPELNRGTIHRVFYGAVYEIKGNLITLTKNPAPDADGNAASVTKELHRVPNYVYTVDTNTGKVEIGDKSDITDYVRDSVNYSKAVFYETKGYDYDLVILK